MDIPLVKSLYQIIKFNIMKNSNIENTNKNGWFEFIDKSEKEPICFGKKNEDLIIRKAKKYKEPVLYVSQSMFKYLSENKSVLLQLFNPNVTK